MKIPPITFFFLFLFLKLDAVTSSKSCPTSCGNVEVNYPFGIGSGCFYPGFELTCEDNKLYILGNSQKFHVLEIMMEGEIRVNSSLLVAVECPSIISTMVNAIRISIEEYMPYTFSTKTRFIAVGCNTEASITGSETGKGNECYLECDDTNSYVNSTCIGNGCCEIALPPATKLLVYFVKAFRSTGDMYCSYAFIAEEWKFTLGPSIYPDLQRYSHDLTMLLDWAIGESSCKRAMYSKDYACGGNSTCVDSNRGKGYLCKCLNGYKGNPYLNGSQGCQDIDECKESLTSLCAPEAKCKNQIPGYTCECPPGSLGNGFKGQGCKKRLKVILTCAGSVIVSGVIMACFTCCYCIKKKRQTRSMYFQQNGGLLIKQYIDGCPIIQTRLFSSSELNRATKNYNKKRILGSGGNGTVYKGKLKDGTVVAIKKSQKVDQSHVDQFINELVILARVNHKNIVKLLGYCLETEVPLLVYEFIPNGTLYHTLHECVNGVNTLSWKDRMYVAKEIAEALSYLHNHDKITIVHRDIKSSNILLDENYSAKLADFGISRLISLNKARVSTAVKGTIGYLDPEYFKTGKLTEKSDVYSYGVVLLELLTSMTSVTHEEFRDCSSLVIHFLLYAGESNVMGIFDEKILKDVQLEELKAMADIVGSCLNVKGEERPTMKDVVLQFELLTSVSSSNSFRLEEIDCKNE